MSESAIKVGVIGAGRWGQNIIRTFHKLGALSAIAETNQDAAKKLSEQYPDVMIYPSSEALLQDQRIDAVAIATPAITHVDMIVAAIQANKHIFVEKPIATNAQQIEQLKQHVAGFDKTLMVGHMLLYQPAITFIKTFIEAGKLGRIFSLRQVRRNLGTVREHENALYSLGVHDIAVLQYLINTPPEKCHAVGQSIIRNNVEDDISVHIRYADGVRAHIHVTWMWPFKQRELMILGEHGALHFDELKQEVVWHKNTVVPEKTEDGSEVVFTGKSEPLTLELAHFLDCVATGKTPISDVNQGIVVADILDSITRQLSDEQFRLQEPSLSHY